MPPPSGSQDLKHGEKSVSSNTNMSRSGASRDPQRQPLGPLSHNTSRRNGSNRGRENDKTTSQHAISITAEDLKQISIEDKGMKKRHISSRHGSEEARPDVSTRTETSQKSLTLGRGFKKVHIAGKFNLKSLPAIRTSHMASSFKNVALYGGLDFHLFAQIAFGANKDLGYSAIFDTGGSDIHIDGRAFNAADAKKDKDELTKSKVDANKFALTRYPDFENLGVVKGVLHKCTVTLGDIKVKDQHFYVDEQAPFPASVGAGPPTETGHEGHSSKDAPTILTNIAKQYGLDEVMGVNVFPWNEKIDEGEEDTLKGSSVHLGGLDDKCFEHGSLRYFTNKTQAEHWGIEVDRITYVKNNIEREKVDLLLDAVIGILDCGAPMLFFDEDIWNKYKACLEQSGVQVFYEQGDRCQTISKDSFPKLRPLTFHLFDEDNGPYTVEIPSDGQVLPPALSNILQIPQDRLALAIGIAPPGLDIVIGIPFFQRRYVIFDLTSYPYRIGLAKTENTGYLSPALKGILDKAKSRQQRPESSSSASGKRKVTDQASQSNMHKKPR